ncbi:MAG: hypothetical protein ACFFEV_10715, partial [Candidatus Thorarchaeota archaeon]
FLETIEIFFLGLVGVIVLMAIYALVTYYKEKRILTEIIGFISEDNGSSYRETISVVLTLVQTELAVPLRVLFVGSYPQATYTGFTYFTTTGIELKEAVIIPDGIRL